MKVACYELMDWSVMNGSIMDRSVMGGLQYEQVCFERGSRIKQSPIFSLISTLRTSTTCCTKATCSWSPDQMRSTKCSVIFNVTRIYQRSLLRTDSRKTRKWPHEIRNRRKVRACLSRTNLPFDCSAFNSRNMFLLRLPELPHKAQCTPCPEYLHCWLEDSLSGSVRLFLRRWPTVIGLLYAIMTSLWKAFSFSERRNNLEKTVG